MPLLTSKSITVGFIAIVALAVGGSKMYSRYRVSQMHLQEITPGDVNIIGMNLSKQYRIIVSNQTAQLVESNNDSKGAQDMGNEDMGGANKKRVPIREMLQSLQGNEKALGRFIMVMNEMKEDDLPYVRVVWTAEDLQKALDGDKALEAKLVSDLNIELDGTPLEKLKFSALENGIVIDMPVTVNIKRNGKEIPVVGRVQLPYKPVLLNDAYSMYKEKPTITREIQMGCYREAARKVLGPGGKKENVREALKGRISKSNQDRLAQVPQSLLESAYIITNDDSYESASATPVDMPDGKKTYTLNLRFTSEGADRLWKYSIDGMNSQLLVVENGIAIAAPRITTELGQRELQITQVPDKDLVDETIDRITKHKK